MDLYIFGLLRQCHVAQANLETTTDQELLILEPLILLPPSPGSWDYRCVPPHLDYVVLRIDSDTPPPELYLQPLSGLKDHKQIFLEKTIHGSDSTPPSQSLPHMLVGCLWFLHSSFFTLHPKLVLYPHLSSEKGPHLPFSLAHSFLWTMGWGVG